MKTFGTLCIALLWLAILAVVPISAQETVAAAKKASADTTPAVKSTGFIYKSIEIGMTADEVRKKLGDPRDRSDAQDFFMFDNEESAQFIYDEGKKVRAIMVTFSEKLDEAPTPKDVFGEDVPAKPDGGVFKMVRYPKAGYWISYSRIAGDDGIISIAMQKI